MKLQAKFYLRNIIIFALLAVVIAVVTIIYVNNNTIREAENRVKIYIRAAWEIHDSKVETIRAAVEALTQNGIIAVRRENIIERTGVCDGRDYNR